MADPELNIFATAEVHQAEGVLCARLGLSISEAAMVLRIRAASAGLSLEDTARDVIHVREMPSDPNIAGSC